MRWFTFCFMLCVAMGWQVPGSTPVVLAAEPGKPALVVVVSIDQFKYEYLERFGGNFAPDGIFRLLAREGLSYTQCHHAHAFTITAPGHSVMLTGTYPYRTGIIGNEWSLRTGPEPKTYCVFDAEAPLIGGKGKGVSPRNLLAETVGDVLRRTTRHESRVFGVSLKDRAAVLMTGHQANAAYWFETPAGKWVSSAYYFKSGKLPGYMVEINSGETVSQYGGRTWNLLYEKSRYKLHYPDDALFEGNPFHLGRAFPHALASAGDRELPDQIEMSPWGSEMTLAVAQRILVAEELGQRATPDLLAINLASNDYIGHNYGPFSLEVEDITYHTDKLLGNFFRQVQKHLAGRPWVLAITADHGVAPIPEQAQIMGLPGRRDPLGKGGEFQKTLETALVAKLGAPKNEKRYVQKLESNQVYLQRDLPELAGIQFAAAQAVVRETLATHGAVASAVTRAELEGLEEPKDRPFFAAFKKTFHPERSGDVLFVLKPYCLAGSTPTTHGTPHEYDTHVPLILWGDGIKPAVVERPVSPAMLAPTLAKLLGIAPPAQCEEGPLAEVWARE